MVFDNKGETVWFAFRLMPYETLDNISYASALALAQWLGVTMEELTKQENDEN